MLPNRLTQIEPPILQTYHFLEDDDRCYFFGERTSGQNWNASYTNQLIWNYKRGPAEIAASPKRQQFQYYKTRALNEIAVALQRQFLPVHMPQFTFVPIPTSKTPTHPNHCDRLVRTLRNALSPATGFAEADIRCLLRQTQDTESDHTSGQTRQTYDQLLSITKIDKTQLNTPLRNTVVLFDDVITSGKHFKVCKTRIREQFPNQTIIGIFVARAIHPNPLDDFEGL